MGSLGSDANLCLGLVSQENALIGGVLPRVHARDAARIAACRVNCKGAVDVTPGLVELDGLPGVLCSLTDSWALNHSRLIVHVLRVVTLHVLRIVVTLNLILSETQGQVKLKLIIVLSALRLLETCLVRVSCGPWATLCSAARVLRPMIIR